MMAKSRKPQSAQHEQGIDPGLLDAIKNAHERPLTISEVTLYPSRS